MTPPSILLTAALMLGLGAGVWLNTPPTLALSLTMTAAWAVGLLGLLRGLPSLLLGGIALLVIATGWLAGTHALHQVLHPQLRTLLEQRFGGYILDDWRTARAEVALPAEDPLTIEGRLLEDAAVSETGVVLRLAVERVAIHGVDEWAPGGVSLSIGGALPHDAAVAWTTGRRIRTTAVLRRPGRFLNHGLADQERALATQGISLVGTVKSAALIEVVAPASWWQETAASARRHTRRALQRHVHPANAQSAAIAIAILIGDRAGLAPELEQRLQEAGTYHVMAISGGNIAILTAVILGVLASVGLRGRVALFAVAAALAAYAFIAAGGVSVARATLMAVLYLGLRILDHRTAAANAVSLAAAIVLVFQPLAIADIGFWLTFGATGALVFAARWLHVGSPANGQDTPQPLFRRALRAATLVMVATLCVEAVLAPIGVYVFQRVTLAGVALNLVAIPAMTLVQLGAMGVVLLDLLTLESAAALSGVVVHIAAVILTESTRLLDYGPWLSWRLPSPPLWLCAGYYTALACTLAFGAKGAGSSAPRKTAAAVTAALFVWIVTAPAARVRQLGDGRLHLTMFDVGQGDAMLVTFPNGRTLVVDCGGASRSGAFDVGDRVLGPALRARGVMQVDYLAVTHGDPDHLGGAAAVVRDFRPREVWWGIDVPGHEPTQAVRSLVYRQRGTWRHLQRFDRVEIGGVEVRVLHPGLPDWERPRVRNDDSLVLELRFGEVSIVLTGDIGKDVEEEVLHGIDLQRVTVLKVAHHGSATSSSAAFMERVRPAIALIGVGRGNPYGHPVRPVIARLTAAGAMILRTDLDGQIDVSTEGQVLDVQTFTGRVAQLQRASLPGSSEARSP